MEADGYFGLNGKGGEGTKKTVNPTGWKIIEENVIEVNNEIIEPTANQTEEAQQNIEEIPEAPRRTGRERWQTEFFQVNNRPQNPIRSGRERTLFYGFHNITENEYHKKWRKGYVKTPEGHSRTKPNSLDTISRGIFY